MVPSVHCVGVRALFCLAQLKATRAEWDLFRDAKDLLLRGILQNSVRKRAK